MHVAPSRLQAHVPVSSTRLLCTYLGADRYLVHTLCIIGEITQEGVVQPSQL